MGDLKIGDKAVYPSHGVGVVTGIECKRIAGEEMHFYVLKILDNGMKVMIPKHKVSDVGLRSIISKKESTRVYQILKERTLQTDNQPWNRRYRDYMDKIKTGSIYEIAEVLRDLSVLKFEKDLSFGERKMFDTAKQLLIKELSLARKVEESRIEKDIKEIFTC